MKMFVLGILVLSLFSCKSDINLAKAEQTSKKEVIAEKTGKKVGGEHKPPIEKSEVVDGHWYCDMGTVHYSNATEGDGKCPLCGMKLHHKEASK